MPLLLFGSVHGFSLITAQSPSDLLQYPELPTLYLYVEKLKDHILKRNDLEDIHGNRQRADDCVHSAYHDEYILKEDAIYSEVLEDWFEDEDTMYEAEEEQLEVEA